MLIRYLRRGLRLLTMLAIIISVLVACNTGDTPIAIRPPLDQQSSQPVSQHQTTLPDPFQFSYTTTPSPDRISLLPVDVLASFQTYSLALLPSGSLLSPHFGTGHLSQISPSGSILSVFSPLISPTAAIPDPLGNTWLLDFGPGLVQKLTPTGILSEIASPGRAYAATWDPRTDELIVGLWFYEEPYDDDPLMAIAPDGTTRMIAQVGLGHPMDVDLHNQNYLVTDYGYPGSGRLLEVSEAGQIRVLATGESFGEIWRPTGIQVREEGIYFGDYGQAANQGKVRLRSWTGEMSVAAEVPGNPMDLVIDGEGELIVSDFWNQRILKLGGVSTPAPQVEGVQILTDIDGQPLTSGDSITLQAQARDPQGQDVTAQIQWTDQEGNLLGSGGNLTYEAVETQMLTIMASVGEERDRVSTTISPGDVTVAPHVKVLSDQVADRVKLVDEEAGIIRLVDEELSYPTIRELDVVIGANGLVPPMKVTGISREEGDLVLSVQPALPKEVIEYGSATFEQTIDWSGSSGEVTIVDIPGEPYHIAEDLEPKWEGFVQAGDPIQTGLKVTASADLEWTPTYRGSIEFDKDTIEGIKLFTLHAESEFSTQVSLGVDGISDWKTGSPIHISILEKTSTIVAKIGPVPVSIRLSCESYSETWPIVDIYRDLALELSYERGMFREDIIYDSAISPGWHRSAQLESGEWQTDNVNIEDMSGALTLKSHHFTKVDLLSNEGSNSELDDRGGKLVVWVGAVGSPDNYPKDQLDFQLNQIVGEQENFFVGSAKYVVAPNIGGSVSSSLLKPDQGYISLQTSTSPTGMASAIIRTCGSSASCLTNHLIQLESGLTTAEIVAINAAILAIEQAAEDQPDYKPGDWRDLTEKDIEKIAEREGTTIEDFKEDVGVSNSSDMQLRKRKRRGEVTEDMNDFEKEGQEQGAIWIQKLRNPCSVGDYTGYNANK